jgi:hypothetical protein
MSCYQSLESSERGSGFGVSSKENLGHWDGVSNIEKAQKQTSTFVLDTVSRDGVQER